MKPINRLKEKEEGRRKEKALINEQVKRGENRLLSWMDARGCRVGTEVDEEQGGRAQRKQQGIVLVHQALGDTLEHIHSFTH